ncbi:MAG: conjugative transposon protein TraK [Bacteroidota bacterium]|nr:conjugative transposon protein TraK [Bacteroidota bacterium]
MFQKAKNIDTAFRQLRLFSIVVVLSSVSLCGYILYRSDREMMTLQSRIYILSAGKALEAFGADRKENLPVEARDHIRMFHHYFFTLDPDEQVIRSHIGKALYLADQSAHEVYENLLEKNYYTQLISGNISQQIEVDSIYLDTRKYPFYFKCFATEKIIRMTATVTRSLITEGYLRNVSRSDHNPHGFLITGWTILENRDLKTQHK